MKRALLQFIQAELLSCQSNLPQTSLYSAKSYDAIHMMLAHDFAQILGGFGWNKNLDCGSFQQQQNVIKNAIYNKIIHVFKSFNCKL